MTRTPTGQTRINFHCPEMILEALKAIASRRGTTYSELIRVACREYVLKQGQRIAEEQQQIKQLGKTP